MRSLYDFSHLIIHRLTPVLFLCFTIRVACRRHRLIHSISSSSFSRPQSLVSLPPWLSAKFVASFYVTDIQVHGTIDDFVTMSDKVHSKAIIKETTVMITRHTWIDVCYLSQRLHASQRPNLIDHLLLV